MEDHPDINWWKREVGIEEYLIPRGCLEHRRG